MSWVRVPTSSFLITSTVFVVFILDMASPGYASFALISDLQPKITALTTEIRSVKENLTRSEPSLTPNIQKFDDSSNCRTLLDAYKNSTKCHFERPNYSNISQ